jgi:hypothetical protein
MKKSEKNPETHPFFPSGEWEGFYTYEQGPGASRHKMDFSLTFHNNIVEGSGSDAVGPFSWVGIYNTAEMVCKMTKHYARHTVSYEGHVDENGIWGSWNIRGYTSGWFHIWPKAGAEEKMEEEVEVKKKVMKRVLAPGVKTIVVK